MINRDSQQSINSMQAIINTEGDIKQESNQQIQINQLTFDDLLTKIGFGKYQILVFVMMGLVGVADGAESLVLSIILPILNKQWGIGNFEQSLLGSMVYVGYFIGSFFSGIVSQKYGRKMPMLMGSIFIFIFALSSSFSPNFACFIVLRSFFGAFVGFIMPLSFAILAEITPIKQRGIMLTLIGVFYTLGELTVCFFSLLTMKNLQTGNWRLLLGLSSIPGLIIMTTSYCCLKESPRYLLLSGFHDQSFSIMEYIANFNSSKKQSPLINSIINEEEKQQIIQWKNNLNNGLILKSDVKSLFQGKFKIITPIIWYDWFVCSLVYYGVSFILPLTLEKMNQSSGDNSNQDLWSITESALGELPTIVVATVLVNIPFFGRKNSWGLSYLIGGISGLIIYTKFFNFVFWVTIFKLSLDLAFTIAYDYTGEVYPTLQRAKGIGLASAFSRIGGIVMPYIGIYISEIGLLLPYLIFGICSLIGGIITFFLPFDTLGIKLDEIQ